MVDKLRSLLSHWVFAKEKEQWDAQLAALERKSKSLNAKDVVRSRMKSYNPRTFRGTDLIESLEINGEDVSTFLVYAHELFTNPARKVINQWLVDNQAEHIARYAGSLDEINFSRYSVNGVELTEEEVGYMEDEYQRRKITTGDFNQFDIT